MEAVTSRLIPQGGIADPALRVPADWDLVWDREVPRNGEDVEVLRWQPTAERDLGGEVVSVARCGRSG